MLRQNRIGDIPDVANNEVMRKLQEQRVTLRAQLALEIAHASARPSAH